MAEWKGRMEVVIMAMVQSGHCLNSKWNLYVGQKKTRLGGFTIMNVWSKSSSGCAVLMILLGQLYEWYHNTHPEDENCSIHQNVEYI